ncbi:MAG: glycogen/starch/alpha-glucan phosphorylase, partial [Acidilobaceae archaeon]
MGVIVSLAMEAAFEGSANYAGGLGVLEADKFYAAGRLGLPYILVVPFYPNGYVDYVSANRSRLVEVRHRHSYRFLSRLEPLSSLSVRGAGGRLIAEADLYLYLSGSARAILYRVKRPPRASKLFKYVYRHHADECTYYVTAAAVSAEIARKYGGDNAIVDVQEAHLALAPYLLPSEFTVRFITHTPGPWGHPRLCKDEAEEALGVSLPSVKTMTEAAMDVASEVYAVSRKHAETTRRLFPNYADKVKYVTNAIDLEKWQRIKRDPGSPETLAFEKLKLRRELASLIASLSGKRVDDKLLIVWSRRIVRYKRPYFLETLAEDVDLKDRIFIFAAGKPHPHDSWGRSIAERLMRISREKRNIYFHPTYDTEIAYYAISGADLLLFTPFSGWEASGTSQMKAMANGTPVLSSR